MPKLASRPSPGTSRRRSHRVARPHPHASPAGARRRREASHANAPLASYRDDADRRRELLALPGRGGSVLVLDRDAETLGDRRLVAHLCADEPASNAALVCVRYIEDVSGRWCRRMRPEDLLAVPPGEASRDQDACEPMTWQQAVQAGGCLHRLRTLSGERSTGQLRWCRRPLDAGESAWEPVSLREIVATLESYEPMRTITALAIARHADDPSVATVRLCTEYERLCTSPIVLNRGLREAVSDTLRRGVSMNEIALRCGVVKRNARGRVSGETSWLARRVGLMPEGGAAAITPWVHSDVLALIARRGLRVSPREVEVQ